MATAERVAGRLAVLGTAVALVAAGAVPAPVSAAPRAMPSTVRASVDAAGGDPSGSSAAPDLSGGGHVAFVSEADDLVAGDGNGVADVFVRDLAAGTTTRVSVDRFGGDGNGESTEPAIAGDRWVAFASSASDLVAGDRNDATDVFVRDLATGTTTRVSVDAAGGDAAGRSSTPSISADGRYVAFQSDAPDLVGGDGNGQDDVFVRDLVAGTTVRVSVDAAGGEANGSSTAPAVGGDRVAFTSWASDLVPGDGNGLADVFVRDLGDAVTTRVSVDVSGGDPDDFSFHASISEDGRLVAYESAASDIVPGDTALTADVFVRDLRMATTVLASVDRDGGPAGGSVGPEISDDGRWVAFVSAAGDLVRRDANGTKEDAFVRDLVAGTTHVASLDAAGRQLRGQTYEVAVSANGRRVAFVTGVQAVAEDRDPWRAVYVRSRW